MANSRLDLLTDYPFQRLADLLHGVAPGGTPVIMSIGEPQHQPPAWVADILTREAAGWGKYPPISGTVEFRAAAAEWLDRRYGLAGSGLDPDRHLLPLAGTREGLFQVAQLVLGDGRRKPKNLVLLPNPFYQVYAGATLLAGGEPVFVPASGETGFLPDFADLPAELLDRVALAYFCSPGNPQGSVASAARIAHLLQLARRHDFVIAADECYSEIYHTAPPPGFLAAARSLGDGFSHLLVFNSLSKRSSAPGLRSGMVAGDADLIQDFRRLRAYGGAAVPLPIQAASVALWRDEAHVLESRASYNAKFDLADRLLGDLPAYRRPQGGFFLWLEVGNGEAVTRRLWREAGVKVLPGAYLGRADAMGRNPGDAYIRVALVHDQDTTERALTALKAVLALPPRRRMARA
jgi:N-succinyldiaminopimelate aminotransferase